MALQVVALLVTMPLPRPALPQAPPAPPAPPTLAIMQTPQTLLLLPLVVTLTPTRVKARAEVQPTLVLMPVPPLVRVVRVQPTPVQPTPVPPTLVPPTLVRLVRVQPMPVPVPVQLKVPLVERMARPEEASLLKLEKD